MPFDGTPRRGFIGTNDTLLDMVELAFDGGKRWAKAHLVGGTQLCLLGAVICVHRQTGCRKYALRRYLVLAIRNWLRRNGQQIQHTNNSAIIITFNDAKCRKFEDIVAVIREARELAHHG